MGLHQQWRKAPSDLRTPLTAWLADVLDKIANRHPMSKIDELLPWAYINNGAKRQAA